MTHETHCKRCGAEFDIDNYTQEPEVLHAVNGKTYCGAACAVKDVVAEQSATHQALLKELVAAVKLLSDEGDVLQEVLEGAGVDVYETNWLRNVQALCGDLDEAGMLA